MNIEDDFTEMYEYFEELTDESKLNFLNVIRKSSVEDVKRVIEENVVDDVMEFFFEEEDYVDDDITDDDTEDTVEDNSTDEYVRSVLDFEMKSDSTNQEEVLLVLDMSYKIMHIYSNSEKQLQKYIYENLFIKGVIFTELKLEMEPPDNIDKKYYKCLEILGQSYHDICYN
jgi:flagellar hook assembly protein FlgD